MTRHRLEFHHQGHAHQHLKHVVQVARRGSKKDLGTRRRETKAFINGASSLSASSPSIMPLISSGDVSTPPVAERRGGRRSRDASYGSERCNAREEDDASLCSSDRLGGEATLMECSAPKSMSSSNAAALQVEQARRVQARNGVGASPVVPKAQAASAVAHANLERNPMPPEHAQLEAPLSHTSVATPLGVSAPARNAAKQLDAALIGSAPSVKPATTFGRRLSGGGEAKVAAGLAAAIAAADGSKSNTKSRRQRGSAAAEQVNGTVDPAASSNASTHASLNASRGGVAAACGPAPAPTAKNGMVAAAEAADAAAAEDQVPISFYCPITQEIMADPVFTSDGQTYERAAIEKWLANHNTSPLTGNQLSMNTLTPNVLARGMIREFLDRHPEHKPKPGSSRTYRALPGAPASLPTQGVGLALSFGVSSNPSSPLSNLLAAGPKPSPMGPISGLPAAPAAAGPLLGAVEPAGGGSGSGLPPPNPVQAAAGVIGRAPGPIGRAPRPCISVGPPSPRQPNQALPGLGAFGPAAFSATAPSGPLPGVVPSAAILPALATLSLPGCSPTLADGAPVNISPAVGRAPGPIGRAPGPVGGKGLVGPGALGSGAPFGSGVLGCGLGGPHQAPAMTGAMGWAGKAATPVASPAGLSPLQGGAARAGAPSASLNRAPAGGRVGSGRGVGSAASSPAMRSGRSTRGAVRNRRGGA